MSVLLKVEHLTLRYRRGANPLAAVRDVSFELRSGETLGLIGESGCGKSTLAQGLLRLLPEGSNEISSGKVMFLGRDVLTLPSEEVRAIRGGGIGMVFQDPFSAMNPVLTVGEQIEEVLEVHRGGRDRGAVIYLLTRVQMADPDRIYGSYPHQLSGGQRQRACLAMAIASKPKILIADEPTTALDVTTQKEILNLLDRLKKDMSLSVLLITHNLGLLAERANRLAVMYAGEIVEIGLTETLLKSPLHPYTQGLLKSLPRVRDMKHETRNTKTMRLPVLNGQPPDLRQIPSGCPFHPRCPKAFGACNQIVPELQFKEGRQVACHLYGVKP